MAAIDPLRFSELASKKGYISPAQAEECRKLADAPEWRAKTIADVMIARGHMTAVQALEVLREMGGSGH
jgi:hypothetical protein